MRGVIDAMSRMTTLHRGLPVLKKAKKCRGSWAVEKCNEWLPFFFFFRPPYPPEKKTIW